MAKYRIKADVPDKCVPCFLTKGKVYSGDLPDSDGMIMIYQDDEHEKVFIRTQGSSMMFFPYIGNPLEEVK